MVSATDATSERIAERPQRQLLVEAVGTDRDPELCRVSLALTQLIEADVRISEVTRWSRAAGVLSRRVAGLSSSRRRKLRAVVQHYPQPVPFPTEHVRSIAESILSMGGAVKLARGTSASGRPTLRVTEKPPHDVIRLIEGGWLEVFAAASAIGASRNVADAQVGVTYSILFDDSTHHSEFDAVLLCGGQLTLVEAKAGDALLEAGRRSLVKSVDNYTALERWRNAHYFGKQPRFRLLLPSTRDERVAQIRAVVAARGHQSLLGVRTTDNFEADFPAQGNAETAGANA